jgi:hypothetical protein
VGSEFKGTAYVMPGANAASVGNDTRRTYSDDG